MIYRIDGMRELVKTINKLPKLPQKVVTRAAKAGMTIALRSAKKFAPKDTGLLRKGIILKGERTKTKGKKAYEATMNAAYNDFYQKRTKSGKRRVVDGYKVKYNHGNYYYPASQEYGFTIHGKYIPGYSYLKKSLETNNRKIEIKIVKVMTDEIDKL